MAPQTRSITRRNNRLLNPGLAISKSTRPYKCCVCRHSFGRTETLNYHWLYSHPGRPLGMPAFVDPSCWGAGNVIENKKWRIWWKWWMADEEVLTRLVEEGEDVLKVMGESLFFLRCKYTFGAFSA